MNQFKQHPHTPFEPEKKRRFPIVPRLVTLILFVLLISGGIFALRPSSPGPEAPRETVNQPRTFQLKQLRPEWYETSDAIYFGIPARIIFHLPEAPGNDQPRIDPEILARKIWDEFDRIGNIFNPFDPNSETGRLNSQNTRGPIPVSKEIYNVLQLSEKLWDASDGAFDPTMLQIKQLWNDAVKTQQIPSNMEIRRIMAHTGLEKVERAADRHEVKLESKNIRFDFGGIAKGYAVDKVVNLVQAHGIENAMVSLAGEIRTFGKNNDAPWRIGIQHPENMNALWGIVSSDINLNISTSGNYRQPLIISGQEFYHIFSPKTGRPVSERILGVTTLCASQKGSSALLDGAATAIIVLGKDKGLAFAETMGIEALILYRSRGGEIEALMTEGFQPYYKSLP